MEILNLKRLCTLDVNTRKADSGIRPLIKASKGDKVPLISGKVIED